MLWRITIQNGPGGVGWVEVGTGFVYADDGTSLVGQAFSYATTDTDPAQPGWYVPTPIPVVIPPRIRRILRRAFRDRFTDEEKQGMEIAALDVSTASQAIRNRQARLRAFLQDVLAADEIDLDRATLRIVVTALEANNVIGVGRAAQILDADAQSDEVA